MMDPSLSCWGEHAGPSPDCSPSRQTVVALTDSKEDHLFGDTIAHFAFEVRFEWVNFKPRYSKSIRRLTQEANKPST